MMKPHRSLEAQQETYTIRGEPPPIKDFLLVPARSMLMARSAPEAVARYLRMHSPEHTFRRYGYKFTAHVMDMKK